MSQDTKPHNYKVGFSEDILTVYDSILLADYALMRHNDPYINHVHGQDRILLLTSARNAGRAGGHNPNRLMDPVVLVYALVRGLYWLGRGYEWYRSDGRRVSIGIREIIELARSVAASLGCEHRDSDDLASMLGSIALCMWKRGLIHYTPCKPDAAKGDVMPYRALVDWFSAGPGDHLALKRLSNDMKAMVRNGPGLEELAYSVAGLISRELQADPSIIPCFKSLHGLIIRDTYISKSLPDRYTIADITLLPLVIEPRSPPGALQNRSLIPSYMKEYIMRSCGSDGEKITSAIERALLNTGVKGLNEYQETFINEYFKSRLSGTRPWGLLTAPTGAGKTLAFTLIVLAEVLAGKCRGRDNLAVLVYPRKTLERQQLEHLARLIGHYNNEIADLRPDKRQRLSIVLMARDGQSPSVSDLISGGWRRHRIAPGLGFKWVHTVKLDANVKVYVSDPWWFIDVKVGRDLVNEEGRRLWTVPDIMVTNYSMLYRILVFSDSGNSVVADRIRDSLSVLVLDEAHLLVGKEGYTIQASLLRLQKDYSIIVSSATLSTLDIIPDSVSTTHMLAVIPCRTLSARPPHKVLEQVTGLNTSDRSIVYVDYYRDYACKVASESSDNGRPIIHRKTIWSIISPSTEKKAETAFLETLVSTLHVNAALRGKTRGRYKSLAFIESKRSLKDVMSKFTGRFLVDSGDIYDRVLLTLRFFDIIKRERGYSDETIQSEYKSYRYIVKPLEGTLQRCSLSGALWDLCINGTYFTDYHNLTPYIDPSTMSLLNARVALLDAQKILEKIVDGASSMLVPGGGGFWIDVAREQAKAMLNASAWEDDDNTGRYLKKWSGPHLVLYHHGDIVRYRSRLDGILEEDPSPLLIIATSTLEVGLNLGDVLYTLHYRIPVDNSRIIQEVGRSGRGSSTLYTSMGIVFVRHNAWETPKRIEKHAVDYFINVKVPETVALSENPLALAMLSITLGIPPESIIQSKASRKASKIIALKAGVESIIESSSKPSDTYMTRVIKALTELREILENEPSITKSRLDALKRLNANVMILVSHGRPPYDSGLTPLETLYIAIETWHLLDDLLDLLEAVDDEYTRKASIIQRFLQETIALSLQELSQFGGVNINEIKEYILQPSRLHELSFTSRKETPIGVTVLGEP